MYLRQMKKSNGRIYLAIYESYRDSNNVARSRSVKSIGYLDEFVDLYDDPIQHFKDLAYDMTLENKSKTVQTINIDLQAEITNGLNVYNVGYLPFKYLYNELGLNDFFINKQRSLNVEFSLNKNLELLVFSRILYPGSKKSTFENRSHFFAPFDSGITKDSVYKSLDFFNQYKDDILKLIWNNSKQPYHRDASKSFYDCTNYYFEIEYNDEDIFDDEGNIIEKGLRKRGPEKNKRPDPIVEMGLLMDASGIPMAYDLFPGNESEKLSLRPLLKKTKAKFGIERTIVVADRGLNTSDNIYFLAGKNDKESNPMDGYVYGQSVRGADNEFKTWVLDSDGYQCELIDDIAFIHKSRKYAKTIKIQRDGKRKVPVHVCQKQMVYYSSKYARKQRKEREKMIEKARDLIDHPAKYTRATSYGAANYVNNIDYDKETGEVKSEKALSLDLNKIKEEEQFDGYYSIVTSEVELEDQEIRKIYRELAKIEDTFKVTKSNFSSRPAFVWTAEHIQGHFFTCFIALVLIRLLEKRLGNKYSVDKIIESTKNYNCTNLDTNIFQFVYRDEIIDEISKEFGVNLNKKYQAKEEIKKILKY